MGALREIAVGDRSRMCREKTLQRKTKSGLVAMFPCSTVVAAPPTVNRTFISENKNSITFQVRFQPNLQQTRAVRATYHSFAINNNRCFFFFSKASLGGCGVFLSINAKLKLKLTTALEVRDNKSR